jgi:hypothetical protein
MALGVAIAPIRAVATMALRNILVVISNPFVNAR